MQQEVITQETIILIIYTVIVIFFLLFFVIGFFIAFQRRKNKLLFKQFEAQRNFEKELATTQLEIQEQILKNIAWELHDNIGQLLTVASMQLNLIKVKAPKNLNEPLGEIKKIVTNTIQEVRNLSKTLNNDVIHKNGLIRSLEIEVERFNRLKFLDATFTIKGDIVAIKRDHEILIFRMFQEFFSNVMKHAKATKLSIDLLYKPKEIIIIAQDNGIGFDTTLKTESSGLQTMKGRSILLQAKYSLISEIGTGTKLQLNYPYPCENTEQA
ncbi:MAG: sensor histidine kinase [Flavobacteriales bacterium]